MFSFSKSTTPYLGGYICKGLISIASQTQSRITSHVRFAFGGQRGWLDREGKQVDKGAPRHLRDAGGNQKKKNQNKTTRSMGRKDQEDPTFVGGGHPGACLL